MGLLVMLWESCETTSTSEYRLSIEGVYLYKTTAGESDARTNLSEEKAEDFADGLVESGNYKLNEKAVAKIEELAEAKDKELEGDIHHDSFRSCNFKSINGVIKSIDIS